jgi:hypothetical protein
MRALPVLFMLVDAGQADGAGIDDRIPAVQEHLSLWGASRPLRIGPADNGTMRLIFDDMQNVEAVRPSK